VARHTFHACPVWIYKIARCESNITNTIYIY
jgi:hypothetical protein